MECIRLSRKPIVTSHNALVATHSALHLRYHTIADTVIHGIAIVGGRYVELELTTTKEEFAQLDLAFPIIAMQCTSWSSERVSTIPHLQTKMNVSSLFNIRQLPTLQGRYCPRKHSSITHITSYKMNEHGGLAGAAYLGCAHRFASYHSWSQVERGEHHGGAARIPRWAFVSHNT